MSTTTWIVIGVVGWALLLGTWLWARLRTEERPQQEPKPEEDDEKEKGGFSHVLLDLVLGLFWR